MITRFVYLILFSLILLGPTKLQAQLFEVGIGGGASSYEGDLAALSGILGISNAHGSHGAHIRYYANRDYSFRIFYNKAKVSGDDANAASPVRKRRNLSFFSNIHEFGAVFEVNLLNQINPGKYYFVYPFFYVGAHVFTFNPQTIYKGRIIDLQPLGTEGQGMDQFPEKAKYSLTQLGIPLGLYVKFPFTEKLHFNIDFGFRWTFTDYLDDVSGSYVNYNELLHGNGELAAALGNRMGERLGTGPVILETGSQRGNPKENDWYLIYNFSLSYLLDFQIMLAHKRHPGAGNKCPWF